MKGLDLEGAQALEESVHAWRREAELERIVPPAGGGALEARLASREIAQALDGEVDGTEPRGVLLVATVVLLAFSSAVMSPPSPTTDATGAVTGSVALMLPV
jgi:hypothetical protein